jgi:hypothetical protein
MAQAAMEGALLNHDRIRKSTDLPLFYGRKDKDTIDPHEFLKRFETASRIANWVAVVVPPAVPNEERKCNEFYMLLRDKAVYWWRSLDDIPDFNINSWNAIKTEFIATYAPRYTARTACLSFGDLVQMNGEGVTDFYLRVSRAYHLIKETRPNALFVPRFPIPPQAADLAAHNLALQQAFTEVKLEGIKDMGLYMVQQLFTGGLHEEIRIKTMEARLNTLDQAYKQALEVETILKDKRGAKALVTVLKESGEAEDYEEDDEDKEILDQVNAIRTSRGKRPIRFTNKPKGKITISCRYCKKPGHFQNDCIKRKKENGACVDAQGKPYKINQIEDGNEDRTSSHEDEPAVQSIVESFSSFYGINSIRDYRSQWFEDTSSLNPLSDETTNMHQPLNYL